jgi:hypothetical protein
LNEVHKITIAICYGNVLIFVFNNKKIQVYHNE